MTDGPRCPAVLRLESDFSVQDYPCILPLGHSERHRNGERDSWEITGVNVPLPVAAPDPFTQGAVDELAERITKLEANNRNLSKRVHRLEDTARDTEADKQPDAAPKEPASQLVYSPERAAPGAACISVFTGADKCIWKCTRDAGHAGRHGVPRYGVIEAETENSAVCDTAFTDAGGSVWTCHRDTGHPGRHGVPSMRVIEAESRTCGCGCGAPTRD